MRRWVVDGNNVMGARPDGWWRDRRGAQRRLAGAVDRWQDGHDDDVLLVFDGRSDPDTVALARPGLVIEFAPGGRDAADDHIATRLSELDAPALDLDVRVVTSDRGLRARLPAGVVVVGARAFRDLVDPPSG